jgi:hypothetical protein
MKGEEYMFESLQLPKAFWVSIIIGYAFCLLSFFVLVTATLDPLAPNHVLNNHATTKLTSIRLAILTFGLVSILFTLKYSLTYAKYVTVALTAWAIAMYFDDHFVLYNMVEYPEGGVISLVQSLRPILIISLIWMCFELTFSPHLTD